MDNKTMTLWMMYYQVQQVQRDGLSILAIAEFLGMNRRTVAKYLAMSEAEFEDFLVQISNPQFSIRSLTSFKMNWAATSLLL